MEQKIATSIQQSKKLLELGLNPETSDMIYPAWTLNDTPTEDILEIRKCDLEKNDVAAWSLSALLSILPKKIVIEDNAYELSIYLRGLYYWNVNNGNLLLEAKDKDSLVDACVEIISILLEQGFIEKGGEK